MICLVNVGIGAAKPRKEEEIAAAIVQEKNLLPEIKTALEPLLPQIRARLQRLADEDVGQEQETDENNNKKQADPRVQSALNDCITLAQALSQDPQKLNRAIIRLVVACNQEPETKHMLKDILDRSESQNKLITLAKE